MAGMRVPMPLPTEGSKTRRMGLTSTTYSQPWVPGQEGGARRKADPRDLRPLGPRLFRRRRSRLARESPLVYVILFLAAVGIAYMAYVVGGVRHFRM